MCGFRGPQYLVVNAGALAWFCLGVSLMLERSSWVVVIVYI